MQTDANHVLYSILNKSVLELLEKIIIIIRYDYLTRTLLFYAGFYVCTVFSKSKIVAQTVISIFNMSIKVIF